MENNEKKDESNNGQSLHEVCPLWVISSVTDEGQQGLVNCDSILQRESYFLKVKGIGHSTEPRFKSGSVVLPPSSILNQCTSNITMGAPRRREKPFHGKLSLTPTRQSLFTVFHSSMKAGANLLNGPLTKRGDWGDCFLIWHKKRERGCIL